MISLFDLLKIGVGPSSSHTMGPMLAALEFAQQLEREVSSSDVFRIHVELFGSLALTGLGHGSDRAVIAGLGGGHPRSIDPTTIEPHYAAVAASRRLRWLDRYNIEFDLSRDLLFNRDTFLPQHPNGMRFTACDPSGAVLLSSERFSVGGGFVVDCDHLHVDDADDAADVEQAQVPHPFRSAEELLAICGAQKLSIAEVVTRNELSFRSRSQLTQGLDEIWQVMVSCIELGCRQEGILPGGLGIRRRAPEIYRKLQQQEQAAKAPLRGEPPADPLRQLDWVNLFALAVNEQNAAGGRVVTAPTNGAAGIIPAVCSYYQRFLPDASLTGVHKFLLTSAAIGMLYKRNASLSAAEMGCQGEIGVACSMAAAGLAAVMGGSPNQIENAAEIGMEHNLGLTCDPVAGLVQVPCIERNTMGAVKAINAARLAVLYGDGKHRVSLDKVIETMRQTGLDMQSKYKETSLGGLAVNVPLC
ncbi:MAG: L-serine ammonia-lyase [Planctomycetales bacterium]|nr:L-serine ammonia-lyase [Planctomycetales bacterium]